MPLPLAIPVERHITSTDAQETICKYVEKNVSYLLQQWQDLRTTKITAWRKIYRGTPAQKYKSFPWKNAANLVPKIVSSFADQLTARLVMGLYGVDPLFPAGLVGSFAPDEEADKQRAAVETFLSQSGKSPTDLNLFYNEAAWKANAIKYGLAALKVPWETRVEHIALSSDSNSVVFDEKVMYDGPRPHPILFEKFLCPLTVAELERAPFCAHIVTLTEMELRDRMERKLYDKSVVEKILASPDRLGPEQSVKESQQDLAGTMVDSEIAKEYDLYECYFPYYHNGQRFHLIATWSHKTKQMARCVFNFFPDNQIPIHLMRLGTDGESVLGMGFCTLLGMYQEEIAQIHNQRRDSGTLANTTIIRASKSSQLDTNFSLYPMAVLSGEDGEFEFMQVGRTTTETIKEEQITLQLATDAAGVGPASAGSGSGTVNKKGAYSAMGTFATSQEGNTRANYHQTTSRFAHLKLGNSLLQMYAHFGISPSRIKAMGEMGQHLQKALESVKAGRLWIPIYAATGSINKEIEKQNFLLLNQQMNAHYGQIAQALQALSNPMVPPDVKSYTMQSIKGATVLMNRILRDFGVDDPSQVNPEPPMSQGGQQQPGLPAQTGAPQLTAAAPQITPQMIAQLAQQSVKPQ